ncbi:MAG: ATP synthase F1 subunit delta [Bacteroidales bacterium]|nr:ATP synthase F1 subunit delta [Bacteroidales bacterium]
MSLGQVSSRYAKALLSLAVEAGEAARVCEEAHIIEAAIRDVPKVRQIISDPAAVPDTVKIGTLRSALGEGPMSASMSSFLALVCKNKRMPLLRFMLHTYNVLYYRSIGVRFASVTTAVPASGELAQRVCASMEAQLGCKVEMEEKVDPAIIGGIVIQVDGIRLDASVRGQIDTLRKEFTKKNKRIV